MRRSMKIVGSVLGVLLLLVAGFIGWATVASAGILSATYEAHSVDIAVPMPASEDGTTALDRGRHLLEARYACKDCHGENLAGGTMVDAFPLGTVLGPNLTSGEGSAVQGFDIADWDRIVRHGINGDGTPSLMPSQDFAEMSDQELSDIVAYIGSLPPVDNVVPEPKLGPLGKILVATGEMRLAADRFAARTDHLPEPPPAEVSVAFGRHLGAVCVGCHGDDLSGGPITGGDPSWMAAANLTPHEEGLGGWSLEDFTAAMRSGVSADGRTLENPMTLALPITSNMTDVEIEAMWMYLQSLPPLPTGS